MKLTDMLQTIEKLGDELLEVPEQLALDLKDKVDSYVAVMDHFDGEIEQYKKLAELFRYKAKTREDELARFKDYTLRSMEAFGWDELKGMARKLKIVRQKRFSIFRDPTAEDQKKLPLCVAQKVTVEYLWDKEGLKEHGEIEGICGTKEIVYVRKT